MLIPILFLFFNATIFSAFCAAITATCTNSSPETLKFGSRFKAAFPSWIASFVVLIIVYAATAMNGHSTSVVSPFVILAILFGGGWGAVMSIRKARFR